MCQRGWAKLHFPEFTLCTFVARVETFLGKIWRVEVEQQPTRSSLTHCYLPAGSPTHVDSTASAPLYHEPSFSFSNSWVRGTFISKWRAPYRKIMPSRSEAVKTDPVLAVLRDSSLSLFLPTFCSSFLPD